MYRARESIGFGENEKEVKLKWGVGKHDRYTDISCLCHVLIFKLKIGGKYVKILTVVNSRLCKNEGTVLKCSGFFKII